MTQQRPANSPGGQDPPQIDSDSARNQLIDHLAVLVVRQHRRLNRAARQADLPDEAGDAPLNQ